MDYVCIDGNNLTLIAYMASGKIKDNGTPRERLYSVLSSMISSLKKKFEGEYYVCWDTYGGTFFRKNLDENYKSTRDNSKFDYNLINSCKDVYKNFGIKSIYLDHCEADDALFALCRVLRERDKKSHITIVSRDRDLLQIIQSNFANTLYDPCKRQNVVVPWYDVVKYKALVGDSSDNIKGVRGIGPKGATKILLGNQQLTENQEVQYKRALKLVDAKLNPFYEKNHQRIKELIS